MHCAPAGFLLDRATGPRSVSEINGEDREIQIRVKYARNTEKKRKASGALRCRSKRWEYLVVFREHDEAIKLAATQARSKEASR